MACGAEQKQPHLVRDHHGDYHVRMGVLIAATIEVLFKFLGVKGERIEIHH